MEALEIIRVTMKEFKSVSDKDVNVFIELSKPLLSSKRFGKLYNQALAYISAHKMKMSGYGNPVAAEGTIGDTIGISSFSEGESSISFTNSQQSNTLADAEFGLTSYGIQFLTLRRGCTIPIISAGER